MHVFRILALGLMLVSIVGCGGGSSEVSVKVAPSPPANELLKTALEELAAKGQPVGSGGMLLQQYVETIGKDDPAKAKALQPHVDSLMSINEPAKVKAKANEMLKLL